MHNNPVEIALEEARRLAEVSQQARDPDLVLSIGTGLSKALDSSPMSAVPPMPSRLPRTGWLKNLFTMVNYQIKLNIDTEKRWNTVKSQNAELGGRMLRINPDLGSEPPSMDDIKQLEPLRQSVQGWLSYDNQKTLVTRTACILVASCFYFERNGSARFAQSSGIELPGRIKCRLSSNPDAIRGLAEFFSAAKKKICFNVLNDPSDRAQQSYELPVGSMKANGSWDDVDVCVRVPGEDASTTISVDMHDICAKGRQYTISGFPRVLMRHDFEGKRV